MHGKGWCLHLLHPLSVVPHLVKIAANHRILASHDALIASGNNTYTQLWLKSIAIEAEKQGLQSAYDLLLERLDSGGHTGQSRIPRHDPTRHPRVLLDDCLRMTVWTPTDWQNHARNKKSDVTGYHQTNVPKKKDPKAVRDSLAYIQNKDGDPINELQASELCHHARSVWEYLHTEGMAPDTWKQCSEPALNYYLDEMYKFYPDLLLCDGDWKAERLVTDNYTGWMRNREKKKERKKVKVEEENRVKLEMIEGTKRKEAPSERHSIKPEKVPRLTSPNTQPSFSLALTTELTSLGHHVAGVAGSTSHPETPSPTISGTSMNPDFVVDPALMPSNKPEDSAPSLTLANGATTSPQSDVIVPTSTTITIASTQSNTILPAPLSNAATSPPIARDIILPITASAAVISAPENGNVIPETGPTSPLLPIKMNLVDPFNRTKQTEGTSRVVGLSLSVNQHNDGKSLLCASHTYLTEGLLDAPTPQAAAPVAATTKKKDMFKYMETSCSLLNLFGQEYVEKHGPSTKLVVQTALEALSQDKRQEWEETRKKKLDARKALKGTTTGRKMRGKGAGAQVGVEVDFDNGLGGGVVGEQ
ncbi:hypothetical protein DXG01_003830 [Tephrocybe rancida]|nr:hypothetical protein DXG01_003830 [Tephrocybe rancida]